MCKGIARVNIEVATLQQSFIHGKMSDTVLKNGASQDETGDDAGMIAASTASLLCPEALKCMARISSLTDCTVITADGREFAVSKAIMAAHSEVLG